MASVYQQVNDLCRALVATCLTSLEKIQVGYERKSFLFCARRATQDNVTLVAYVMDRKTNCQVEKTELLEQTLKVRNVVVKLVTHLRAMHQASKNSDISPLASTGQQVNLLRNELKIVMQKVGLAAHQLSLAESGMAKIKQLSITDSGGGAMKSPNESLRGGGPHEQCAVACLDALAQMSEALRQRNREDFTNYTRKAINNVNALLAIRLSGAVEDNRLELRQNLVAFISHSKMYFVHPDDDTFRQNFEVNKEKVETSIKKYLPNGYDYKPPPVSTFTSPSMNPPSARDSPISIHPSAGAVAATGTVFVGPRIDTSGGGGTAGAGIPAGVEAADEGTSIPLKVERPLGSSISRQDLTTSMANDSIHSSNSFSISFSNIRIHKQQQQQPLANIKDYEEESSLLKNRFGSHRRGDIFFDHRALNEVLDDDDDDFETSEALGDTSECTQEGSGGGAVGLGAVGGGSGGTIRESDTASPIDIEALDNYHLQQFSQAIVEKVKAICPNDWGHLDTESKDVFEKQVQQMLLAHKRLILSARSHNNAMSGLSQYTIIHERPKAKSARTIVPSVQNILKGTLKKPSPLLNQNSPTSTPPPPLPPPPALPPPPETSHPPMVKLISENVCSLIAEIAAFVVHFSDTAPAFDKTGKVESLRDKTKDHTFRKKIIGLAKKVLSSLKDATNILPEAPKDSIIEKVKTRVTNELVEKEGNVLPLDEGLLSKGQYCRYSKQCLLVSICGHSESILNLSSQLASILRAFDPNEEIFLFDLLTLCSLLNGFLSKVLDDVATFHYLGEDEKFKKNQSENKLKKPPSTPSGGIWDEPAEDPNASATKDITRPGTLQTLIIRLTSQIFSVDQLNAFLSGYEMFTSPTEVWEKLEERYLVPQNALPNDQAQFVKMRCSNIMLHWLKKDLHSIDLVTLTNIERFASTTLVQDKFTSISQLILSELESTGRFEVKSDKTLAKELKIFDDPTRILFLEEKIVIAEQMTLIDFEIYERIAYIELTDMKWNENKEKYHILSRNVINFIRRSNYLALFVATNILLQKKIKDRTKLLERFIGIAKYLADMHNFNSLMGILVGLGQASIDRLKLTWGRLPSKHIETYKILQQYFNPGNSFKFLREKLRAAGGNALPYLGCVLGDLTFMDEGNPNFIEVDSTLKLINFPKHHLINRSISEIQQFQKTKFNLTLREPLYTFLQQMPVLYDRELFALSLEREPRQPNPI